jgi:hypothetical protein
MPFDAGMLGIAALAADARRSATTAMMDAMTAMMGATCFMAGGIASARGNANTP